jgi:hypothetical protein
MTDTDTVQVRRADLAHVVACYFDDEDGPVEADLPTMERLRDALTVEP